jgi:hypothetical protein
VLRHCNLGLFNVQNLKVLEDADVPLDFEGELHWLNKVNFSCPRIATRSGRANHANYSLPDMVEELSPKL